MKRREFIRNSGIGLAGLSALPAGIGETGPLNVVTIISDQLRADVLGCMGSELGATPHIDALAAESTLFEQAFTACPICVPNRASMLTGLYPRNSGIVSNKHSSQKEMLNGSEFYFSKPTIDEFLADNGYATYYFGKWHNPEIRTLVYDNVSSMPNTMVELYEKHHQFLLDQGFHDVPAGTLLFKGNLPYYSADVLDAHYDGSEQVSFSKPSNAQHGESGQSGIPSRYSLTAYVARESMNVIKSHSGGPFALTCSINAPHHPLIVSPEYYDRFPPEQFLSRLPKRDDHQHKPYAQWPNVSERYSNSQFVSRMWSNYMGLVAEMDEYVGKLIRMLKQRNLWDNTLVIFTSDHGEMLGAHQMRGKGVFYRESQHIPMIVKWPAAQGIAPGRISTPVSQVDIPDTIADCLGYRGFGGDGKSLRRFRKGNTGESVLAVEWSARDFPNVCLLNGDYKLMYNDRPGNGATHALFNRRKDPDELVNLLASPKRLNAQQFAIRQFMDQLMSSDLTGRYRLNAVPRLLMEGL